MTTGTVDMYGHCPHCGADWDATRPGDDREYSHLIAIYDRGMDSTAEYACHACDARFPRGQVTR